MSSSTSTATATATTTGKGNNGENNKVVRVALLGSGIFATNCHAPTIRSNSDILICKCVWSRRIENSKALIEKKFNSDDYDNKVDAYGGEDGLQTLLQRSNDDDDDDNNYIDAVIIALPLDIQPKYVIRCLQAGKHVLSEKPIASNVTDATELLIEYQTKYQPLGLIWSVAENFRCEPGLIKASKIIQNNTIGTPLLLTMAVHSPFTPDNQYLNTSWRSSPSWEGGLFVDAFIHSIAGLRMMMVSSGGNNSSKAMKVSATTSSHTNHIPDIDTMAANITFDGINGGLQAVVTVTYASNAGYFEIQVTGTNGRMIVTRKFNKPPGYKVTTITNDGITESEHPFGGIPQEFRSFATSILLLRQRQQQNENNKNKKVKVDDDDENNDNNNNNNNTNYDPISPIEALADLIVVEACIQSGKKGGELVMIEQNQYKTIPN